MTEVISIEKGGVRLHATRLDEGQERKTHKTENRRQKNTQLNRLQQVVAKDVRRRRDEMVNSAEMTTG